ncbi:MAG: DUF1080 domain-containing protein [Acidobacteriota bacterium]
MTLHNSVSARSIAALLLLFAAATPLGAQSDDGWTPLFNGTDLTGWRKLGGDAEYSVENGVLVGLSKPSRQNTFLVTEKSYDDFVLELEFKVDSKTNSGIQVRSEADPEKGRVFGYQIEIDPSERAWTGGLYDEARRGWLYPLDVNQEARAAFRSGEWNTFRIECLGPSIRSWLNGVPATHLLDDMTSEGFIGLQVHAPYPGVADDGQKVWWRNLRIKTEGLEPATHDASQFVANRLVNDVSAAEQAQGWSSIFDGKSTDGWRPVHGEAGALGPRWSVEDGALVVGGDSSYSDGRDVVHASELGAFELQLEFRLAQGANSGIKYFVTEEYHPGSQHGVGLEYQLLDDSRHPDAQGERGELRKLGALYDLLAADKQGRFVRPPGQWNHARIVAYADGRIEHWLNHRKVLDVERHSAAFSELVAGSKYAKYSGFGHWTKGRILLQDHGDKVEFRSIKLREL